MNKLQKFFAPVPDEMIHSAIEDALKTAKAASELSEVAINKALFAGQLLREKREVLGAAQYGQFSKWLEKHCALISRQTAYTWMELAERVTSAVEVPQLGMPVSSVLSSSPNDLPDDARQYRQLMLDFTEGKSIRGCLRDAVLDGEESRLKRAFNGKTKGGSKGENRKDFPKFIGNKLSDITTHLESWDKYTAAQIEQTETAFKKVIGQWPTALLGTVAELIKKEMKSR